MKHGRHYFMKGSSSIVSAIQHLKMAHDHFEDFERENPGGNGARLFRGYRNRLNLIATDLITHPFLPEGVRQGIKNEWLSDVFAVPAIMEKIALLTPEQREAVEYVIEQCLNGETLKVEHE